MYKIYRHRTRNKEFIIENLNVHKETPWCYYDNLQSASFCDNLTHYTTQREFLLQTTSLKDFFKENPTFEVFQSNHPELLI